MCNPAFFLRNSVRVPIVPLSFFPSFLYSSEGDGAPPQKIMRHNACVSPPLPALSMDVCMWHMRNLSGSSSQSNHLPQSHDWLIEDKNETIVVRDRHILLWGQFMSSECSGEASESQRYCVTLETTQREWKIVKSSKIELEARIMVVLVGRRASQWLVGWSWESTLLRLLGYTGWSGVGDEGWSCFLALCNPIVYSRLPQNGVVNR